MFRCALRLQLCAMVGLMCGACAVMPPPAAPAKPARSARPAPTSAAPAATMPAADLPPAAALTQAIAMLNREARLARQEQKLLRTTASFASAYPPHVDSAAAQRKVLSRVSNDPLIDAYVRWQLTGFVDPAATIEPEELSAALNSLPRLLDNPRSDSVLIATFNSTMRNGELTPEAQTKAQRRLDQMQQQTEVAEQFNIAPVQLREWLFEHLPPEGIDRTLAAIEFCHAQIRAGWDAGTAKQRLERELIAARNRGIDEDDRVALIDALHQIIGNRTLYIRSARFQDATLLVEYAESSVDDFEVRRWEKALTADEP